MAFEFQGVEGIHDLEGVVEIANPPYLRTLQDSFGIARQVKSAVESIAISSQFQEAIRGLHLLARREAELIQSLSVTYRPELLAIAEAVEILGTAGLSWGKRISDLVESLHTPHLIETHPLFLQRMMAPSMAFASFAQSTLEQLEQVESELEASALSAVLVVSEGQLVETIDTVVELGIQTPDADEKRAVPGLTLFPRQRADFLALVPKFPQASPQVLMQHSVASNLFKSARRVIQLLVNINRACKLLGKQEIFTPTTTLIECCSFLPMIQVIDESSLGSLVDQLYLSLYEGAGKDRLRFLEAEGGFLSNEEAAVVWNIKHLRNKFLRHDPDHGDPRSIQKSWADLKGTLNNLGISHLPSVEAEYLQLQINLLTAVEAFLQRLLAAINRSLGSPT